MMMDSSDPAAEARPMGYSVLGKRLQARYAPGTRARTIERKLCRNDSPDLPQAQIPAEAKLHAREKAIPDIAAQIIAARRSHRRILRKKRHDRLRRKLNPDRQHQSHPGGNEDGIAQRLPGALGLARADILRADRRYSRQHGRRNQEQKAHDLFHNAHGSRIRQPALIGQDGNQNERYLDKSILRSHWQPDAQNARKHAALRMEIAPGYAHIRRMPTQRQQGGNHADGLRQRSAQRRARRAHA